MCGKHWLNAYAGSWDVDHPIRTPKQLEVDHHTGEWLNFSTTQYGELSRGKLIGLCNREQYYSEGFKEER
ncbi:hypothetical protein MSSD14B_35110 [Marinobacter salsuginis]|uniref:Uncharacterized protein n=1 Tax=Marinobacter salsuginis TaxID=418719 RepID=A0A5M3Q3R3_9GAMM|nr:hypothetical protein MSSD14B_35110 [Marinobacter salsuginis]